MKKMLEKHGKARILGKLAIAIAVVLFVVARFLDGATAIMTLDILSIVFVLLGEFLYVFKMFKDNDKVRIIGGLLAVAGLVLFVVAGQHEANMVMNVIGLLSFLVGGFMYIFQTKEHRLGKLVLFFGFTAMLLTWVFSAGQFQGGDLVDAGMNRLGLTDIGTGLYYVIYFTMDKILFLLVVAGFYGVLSRISGYQNLVTSIAKKLKNHEIIAAVVTSFIIVVLTSMISQTMAMLIFIPFFVSVLYNMKLDKLSVFAITFGSALVGILGATYGTDSLVFFNNYIGTEITTGILYRLIIAVVAFVLYNFFICMRLKKVLKEKGNKNEDIEDDPFKVEAPKKKTSKLPMIIVLAIFAIVIVLGFVSWTTNFNITMFDEFHEWLGTFVLGAEEIPIITTVLGLNAKAFGLFDLLTVVSVLILTSGLLAFLYHVSFSEYMENFFVGIKKMVKPILLFVGAYFVFAILNIVPVIPTITSWALNLTTGLNPYIASATAFFTSMFHTDFGYTGYTIGSFLTTVYASEMSIVHTIYVSMYGLVQMIMPTGVLLIIGLGLMKLDYKEWFKYIWLFVIGMLIILLVLFTVLTYL